MDNKISPERQALMGLSKRAKSIQDAIELNTGERPSINSILLKLHQDSANTSVFKMFHEWKSLGYRVKRNEKAYRIWGSPKKGRKQKADATEKPSNDAGEADAGSYQFYPMCCLFSDNQVEKL